MHIEELSCKRGSSGAKVNLSYEDIRDVSNALYNLSKDNPEYEYLYVDWKVLFDLVKHGQIQPETVKRLAKQAEDEDDDGGDFKIRAD